MHIVLSQLFGPISSTPFFVYFYCESTGPGRHPHVFVVKFTVECTKNHVLGPPGARVMGIFVKTYIFVKVELGDDHG